MDSVGKVIYEHALRKPNGIDIDEVKTVAADSPLETVVNVLNQLIESSMLEVMSAGDKMLYRALSSSERERLSGMDDEERLVYKQIENSGDEGIWVRTLHQKTNLPKTIINRCIKSLEQNTVIKSVKSIKHPTRKLYMLAELTPSQEITGGPWYTDQEMDMDFIEQLANQCYVYIYTLSYPRYKHEAVYSANHTKYPTSSQIQRYIAERQVSMVALSTKDIEELLTMLVYDGKIERIAPAFDIGGKGGSRVDWMYRALRTSTKDSPLTEIPCGRCPVASRCSDTGPVTPAKCKYLSTWLSF
ncbi:34-kDa subunit of RNA polymerase III (C) [Coemansia sp. RSA 552]|nr:34-kDa subunit of RNA polymerase III (C) [Coemansia sp. RSA 552]